LGARPAAAPHRTADALCLGRASDFRVCPASGGYPEAAAAVKKEIDDGRPLLIRQLLKRWHPALAIFEQDGKVGGLSRWPMPSRLGSHDHCLSCQHHDRKRSWHVKPEAFFQFSHFLFLFLHGDHAEEPGGVVAVLIEHAFGVDGVAAPFGAPL